MNKITLDALKDNNGNVASAIVGVNNIINELSKSIYVIDGYDLMDDLCDNNTELLIHELSKDVSELEDTLKIIN